jgi:hypothetical protein
MLLWRDRWNNLEVPETWNTSCLSLILDADSAYQKRQVQKERTGSNVSTTTGDERPTKRRCLEIDVLTASKNATAGKAAETKSLLKPQDRALFDLLVSYKVLELNLETSLTARVGWTPEKTSVAIGPTVVCQSCDFPRSITIMGLNGKCGVCLAEFSSLEEKSEAISHRVHKDDNEKTPATWVECNIKDCRAQYVVYHREALNVKPKCHYCRVGKETAPFVTCSKCLNRVIWPFAYRPDELKDFLCYACTTHRKTIVDVETTANKLAEQNTTGWLLRNDDNKICEPFSKRSLFYTISKAGVENMCDKVEILPASGQNKLTLNGKLVRNAPDLVSQLESWISRRRAESGICSLCFSSMRKSDVLPACGRSGCGQRVCKGCLEGWYGLNAPGRIINTAALSCPFCRRDPTAKTLAKYGMGIHAVGDLRIAVRDKGQWVSAWCRECSHAKRYIERVCAAGAPAELKDWVCDECGALEDKRSKFKKCPGCGTMTEKTSGCDHIMCTVNGCGTHWCFFCGAKSDVHTIYTHMSTEHGGYYGGTEDEGDLDTDEEY